MIDSPVVISESGPTRSAVAYPVRQAGSCGRWKNRRVTGPAAALLGVALVLSVLDWAAVARRIRRLEYACKPAAAAAFLATALALDPASDASRTWCCVALGCCIVGDVFL